VYEPAEYLNQILMALLKFIYLLHVSLSSLVGSSNVLAALPILYNTAKMGTAWVYTIALVLVLFPKVSD
jgi:hypothetical protein